MKKIAMTLLRVPGDEPIFGYWWVDALMSGAARAWTFYADLGALLLTPFTTLFDSPDCATHTQGDVEESEGEEDSEEEQLELLKQLAHTTVTLDPEVDRDEHAQTMRNLFQLMVSTGIIEFTTNGHSFKLVPDVIVTPVQLPPTPTTLNVENE
jgi:hypothetical protein